PSRERHPSLERGDLLAPPVAAAAASTLGEPDRLSPPPASAVQQELAEIWRAQADPGASSLP
ncbi:MAG: hypothetical protein VKO39_07770, partial [Cyanobacteriota bacterium]|nr:hypothetical protein [Cyanobacteriota bacterium]